ncbi:MULTISPECIES: NCS2 family permease [Nitrospirillum]|uniref:AGZA family xanthine/uracil permease-like MFS transporter n=1 Tax=Nitrospirillum amazonense TaxID=28077 RepID=A0A560G1C2_9PROT|nr:NCS2 family permease [Nitrospirillum amazonense]MEC4589576.1 NCS2 family permease [Nitrospirillum amazonense]TWB27611.1 AGZA family xanthine/uracil permease-like MFS transporter [Nitrospirillum amazonense]
MLDRFFGLTPHGTTVRTEILAGVTTFLTMAYIIFVNPQVLGKAGMDPGAVFVATCLASALGCFIMGLYANYPIALAPGMGLNAYFAYSVVGGMGYPWPVALGAVFLSGVGFTILSLLPVREAIINAIPTGLKHAISAGIGLFLGLIALQNAGIVAAHPATMVTLGPLGKPQALLACAGFLALVVLVARGVTGAVVIAIIGTALAGMVLGVTPLIASPVSLPPNPAPTLLRMDVAGAFNMGLTAIIFAFLFVDLFDTAGTLVGVSHRAGLLDARGRLPRLKRALLADSLATTAGAMLGTSTVTAYIESAAGTFAGGRTGLTAVVVGLLFLAALFLSPLAAAIPGYATAPALFYVACLMVRGLAEIDWDDVTDSVPAVITALAMPFTFSIADGIAFGLIAHCAIKLLTGKGRELGLALPILAALFMLRFALA